MRRYPAKSGVLNLFDEPALVFGKNPLRIFIENPTALVETMPGT